MKLAITKEWFQRHADLEGDLEIGAGHPCYCIGPQNGQRLCPCMMRDLHQVKDASLRERIVKAADQSLRILRDR